MGIKREGTIFLQSLLFRSSRRTALANLWWCSPQRVGFFWFPPFLGGHNVFILEVAIGVKLSLERERGPREVRTRPGPPSLAGCNKRALVEEPGQIAYLCAISVSNFFI